MGWVIDGAPDAEGSTRHGGKAVEQLEIGGKKTGGEDWAWDWSNTHLFNW